MIRDKENLSSLFLACVFPIHLWSLVIVFRNIENVITRSTNFFDGLGYASYSLLLALFESVLLFMLLWLLSALFPKRWPQEARLLQLVWLAWVMPAWAALAQLYQYWFYPWQQKLIDHFFLWLTYRRAFNPIVLVLILLLIVVSVAWPLLLLLKNKRFMQILHKLIERVKILSYFYLVLDAMALLLVIFRNVWVLL